MKCYWVFILLAIKSTSSLICPEDGLLNDQTDFCNVFHDNEFVLVEYNCSQICCGGKLSTRSTKTECCGNEDNGKLYDEELEVCCYWWFTDQYAIHEKQNKEEQCCGISLFLPEYYSNGSNCCYGWKTLPTIFQSRSEMCCEGVVSFVGDTSFGQCCGTEGYDKRVSSCPCSKAPVAKGIVDKDAKCCRSYDSFIINTYHTELQGCCNGVVFNLQSQFCCNDVVGDSKFEICCEGKLMLRNPEQKGASLGCCNLLNGSLAQFNAEEEVCCVGEVTKLPAATKGLCCGDSLSLVDVKGSFSCCVGGNSSSIVYDLTTSVCCGGVVGVGDSCCGTVPFLSEGNVCCNGEIGVGDACCGGKPYSSSYVLCCDGNLGEEYFAHPACCASQTFDSFTHTCCGSKVYENPIIPTIFEGIFYTSHTTRCCGNYSDAATLYPYDYFYSLCCNGVKNDIGFEYIEKHKCCGSKSMNIETEICCDDVILPKNLLSENSDLCE